MTEQEMRDSEAPTPTTEQELQEYIRSLMGQEHDYGTCVYAMSLAATATFNYMASQLGVTGFQASCADLDIIRRTRLFDGPFMLINGEDILYPQYDLHQQLQEALNKWKGWAAEQAQKKIEEHGGQIETKRFQGDDGEWHEYKNPHPEVWAHWQKLAGS